VAILHQASAGQRCDAREQLNREFVGRHLDKEIENQIQEIAGAGPIQVLGPKSPAPNNYLENRITVKVDKSGIIRRIGCEELLLPMKKND
jgi:hypothetical protein